MNKIFGITFFLVASILTLPMFALLKIASSSQPLLQVLGLHFITSCLCLAPFVYKKWKVAREDQTTLLARVISGLITFHGVFIAAKFLPIAATSTLLNTSPFFAGLFLWLILKRSLRWRLWGSILLGFVGILMILRPGGFLHPVGASLALIAGMCSGLSMVLSQKLVQKIPAITISFYALLAGALIHLPLVFAWDFSSLSILPVFSGIFFAIELFCFTKAFQYLDTTRLAPLNYTGVVLSLGLDMVYFHTIPNTLSIFGILLVCLCGTLALYWSQTSVVSKVGMK